MNALCAIDNGLLSANGLLTPEPPTNLAVNYTISIPLDSDPDLVLHYPFNQNILDYPGTNPTTGISDAIIVGDSSKIYLSSNYSIFSNGTSLYSNSNNANDYLLIDSGDTSIANTKGYTFSYWIYLTKTPTLNDIIYSMRQNNSSYSYKMSINSTNQLVISYRNNSGTITNITVSTIIILYTWFHIVWTLNTSSISNVYINSLQVVVNNTSLAYYTPMINNKKIFGDTDGVNTSINGYMNDFRYYNRILDSAEVFQLYNIYSLKLNSGLQWQSFYGNQRFTTADTINLPTTGKLNSFQYNAYYSGGNNNSLSSNSSNLLTSINYTNNIAVANNIFGFTNNVLGSSSTANAGLNIGLLVYGYFRPNISGGWILKLDTDNFGALWFNDGSGGSSFWPPIDTNYRITGNVTAPSYNTASLIAGTYYPFQITWSQFNSNSKFIFSITPPSGTITTNGTGYFFSQIPTTVFAETLNTGLLLYYPFDGDILNYASGTGVNDGATISGGNVYLVSDNYIVGTGSLYKSIAYNNTDYFVASTLSANTGGYSFSLWVYFSSSDAGMIFSFATYVSAVIAQNINLSTEGDYLQIFCNGNSTSIKSPSLNTWNHYVWTLDTGSNNCFYINGDLISGFPNVSVPYASFAMNYNYIFGNSAGEFAAYGQQGYVDDFRYYNRILTQSEVTQLYNMYVPSKVTPDNLILYYPFNANVLNYASGGSGVTNGSYNGTVSLNATIFIIGSGSLRQSASNSTSRFSVNALAANKNGYTFSLWFYLSSITAGTIFSFANNLNSTTRITFANTGTNLSISCNGSSKLTNLTAPSINTWTHYVWSLDTNNNSNYYINGVLQSGFPTRTIPYASFAMNSNYILGDTNGGNGQQGYVDDFRYYDSILTQTDVSVLYNMRGPSGTPPLILHYPFDSTFTNYGLYVLAYGGDGVNIVLSNDNYIVGTGSLYREPPSSLTSKFNPYNNLSSYRNTDGFSFSLWVSLTATTQGFIFAFDNFNDNISQRIYFYNTGSQLRISSENFDYNIPSSLFFPKLNTWTHYVWTLTTSNSNSFYINGALITTTTIPQYITNSLRNFAFLGDSLITSPGNGVKGYMDDFRYYNGILNQSQISALYKMKGPLINTPKLILYYPFNTDISNYTSITEVTNGSIVGSTVSLSNTNYAVGTGSLYQSASNTTSYFSIPTIPTNIVGFSFSLWVYFTSMNDGMIFSFAAGTATSNNRIFVVLFSATIRLGFNGSSTYTNTSITPISKIWYHYVWTLDKTNKNNFYVNGVLLYNSSTTPTYLTNIPLSINRILGNTTTTAPTNGAQAYVDDFRYYDGILSPTQVTELYNLKNPQNFNPNTDSALCIYYPFDISRNYVVNYAASVYGTVDANYVNRAVVDYMTNKVGTGALKLFSTSSQYVELNSNSIVQNTNFISSNGMSFSLWIKSNNTASNAAIFYFGYNDTDYIGLFFDNNGISISCKVYNTQLISVGLSINYNNNIWRHVVWTLGFSSSNTSRWNIYIDGSMVSVTSNNCYPISTTPKTISRLGRDGGSIFYNGWIDDFRVYQRVLNQLEVTQLYNYQDTSANFPTLNADAANFTWTPPARNGGVSYNYYTTDNTLNTSSATTNTKATNALIPEINIDNSNSYYVNSQRGNKQSVYANITI